MQDRAAGYRAALAEAGLESNLVQTDGSAEDGARATVRLLAAGADVRPDALFAATDRLAIAALGVALDHGLRVPHDLAIVGFDDTAVAAYLRPSLSSVAQPARQLGETAIALALGLLAGQEVEPVLLPAQLVVRQSSA
jgi:LacI family transcriptional regulator